MDKNQINIDDLFRNRLSDGEERERPGSWLAMRDLLDKEMPVQAAFNWRRMFGFITGILIATSVSVGGYKYYAHRSTVDAAAHSPAASLVKPADLAGARSPNPAGRANTTSTTTHNTHNTVTAAPYPASSDATVNAAAKLPPATEHTVTGPTSATRSRHTGTGRRTAAATTGAAPAIDATGTGTQPANAATGKPVATTVSAAQPGSATAPDNTAATQNQTIARTATGNPGRGVSPAAAMPGHTAAPAANAGNTTSAAGAVAAADATQPQPPFVASASFSRADIARSSVVPASSVDATFYSQPSKPGNITPPVVTRKDTIQQIEIVYRSTTNPLTQKPQVRIDTIARYNVIVDRITPVKPATPAVTTEAAVLPAPAPAPAPAVRNNGASAPGAMIVPAASAADAAAENNLVSLSKFRVSSKFHNAWNHNAERLSQFARNVSFAVARSQFYAGITGGFNATAFSVNTLAGFQLGMTGLLAFNERWSIAAELKYFQRFNNGSAINDDYVHVTDRTPGTVYTQNGVQYQPYSWNEDKVVHYFNFTTVQTLEAPITLRRNIGRAFGEVGLNLLYAFAINAEEIDRPVGSPEYKSQAFPIGATPEAIGSGRPQVTLADFGGRFGLGYAIGAGYEFTPALNANVKLVKNFWDNGSTEGAQKISRNLYQTPSVQLSIGYRFSQNKSVKPVDHP